MTGLDAHAVSASLAARIDQLVRDLLPLGKVMSGHWRVGNLNGAKGASLAIALSGNRPGLWIDHATDEKGDALDLIKAVHGYKTPEALEWSRRWLDRHGGRAPGPAPDAGYSDDEARRMEWALAIWEDARSPRQTLVETYLDRRALKLTDALAGEVIRFHRACPWKDANDKTVRVPAMIAAMRSIATNQITAIQRTRLSPEGRKIERRMLGIAAGAAVKVDRCVTNRLIITEGTENAMTARQLGLTPAWALGSAGAIEHFQVLDQIEKLMILAEKDAANARAREICGTRWSVAGREVVFNFPTRGNDLNEALQSARPRRLPRRWRDSP
jgi:hypothetical protein